MQEIATIPRHTASIHRYVAGDLLHPQFARVNGDAGDIHPAALEPLTVIRTMVRRMLAGSNAGGPSEYRFVRE
jgi:hypothetical protein